MSLHHHHHHHHRRLSRFHLESNRAPNTVHHHTSGLYRCSRAEKSHWTSTAFSRSRLTLHFVHFRNGADFHVPAPFYPHALAFRGVAAKRRRICDVIARPSFLKPSGLFVGARWANVRREREMHIRGAAKRTGWSAREQVNSQPKTTMTTC
ncbi:hypothetical protein ZHAS_00002723 [Anopheles sinensis]|uniref:Uncharacterized protein n=1 Tax=Anopheles sinensis TaxID=74873 RepID=A0A084VCV8_ANOSI|nr:hypothetical protein ZHAS_00002723 [Anopheles sinensis]